MSHKQEFELELTKLDADTHYLVRECAHEIQQVLDRYKTPLVVGLAVALVAGELQEKVGYELFN
jgi:hypothetical protein